MGIATPSTTNPRTHIEQQATDLLDDESEIDATSLASHLEFSHWLPDDEYPEWHTKTEMEPMLRALFLRELMNCRSTDSPYTKTDHERRLRASDMAEQFGFDLDEDERAPCRTTYDRTWNDRLSDDLQQYLAHTATRVREYAHSVGNPLGLHAFDPDSTDKSGCSKRTENRLIRKKTSQVLDQTADLIFPLFEFGRAENAKYDDDMFLGAQCLMNFNNCAAEQGMELYGDNIAEATNIPRTESDTETAKHTSSDGWLDAEMLEEAAEAEDDEDGPEEPTGGAHLRTIRLLDRADILETVHEGVGLILNAATRHTELFDRHVDVAIDITYVGYWADGDELEMVMGAPPDKEYDECFEFATLAIVGENVQFTLAMRPRQKGERYGTVVRNLLAKAKQLDFARL
jgi:hypothetical protein